MGLFSKIFKPRASSMPTPSKAQRAASVKSGSAQNLNASAASSSSVGSQQTTNLSNSRIKSITSPGSSFIKARPRTSTGGADTGRLTNTEKSLGQIVPDELSGTDDDEDDESTEPETDFSPKSKEEKEAERNKLHDYSIFDDEHQPYQPYVPHPQDTQKSQGSITAGYESSESSSESNKSNKSKSASKSSSSRSSPPRSPNESRLKLNLDDLNSRTSDNLSSRQVNNEIANGTEQPSPRKPVKAPLAERITNKRAMMGILVKTGGSARSATLESSGEHGYGDTSNRSTVKFRDETDVNEKMLAEQKKLKTDNKRLRHKVDDLEKMLLDIEVKHKQEVDVLMIKYHDNLKKELSDGNEREALTKRFLSKQQENNEKVMNEQGRLVDVLRAKCDDLEAQLKKSRETNNSNLSNIQLSEARDEVTSLKQIVTRLNAELSAYQAKYPVAGIEAKQGMHDVPVDVKQLMPLIARYDEQFKEKDTKLNLMKQKVDDLMDKFNEIINENNELHAKLESGSDPIRAEAKLVLEENRALAEQLAIQKRKVTEAQRGNVQDASRLAKRVLLLETDLVNAANELEVTRASCAEMARKYNDASAEMHRRVSLDEHLSQVGELRRKIEELQINHKQELQNALLLVQTTEKDKKDLMVKYTNLYAENKRLEAENQVLEKALDEGLGRKAQQKMQDLQNKLEIVQLKQRKGQQRIEQLTRELERYTLETERFQNLAKSAEIEFKKSEQRLREENLKMGQVEEKLEDYKEKIAGKLARTIEKLQQKDIELAASKVENEKKLSKMLTLLQKKQDEIDDFLKMKGQIESQLDNVWKTTSSDNAKLKELLFEVRN